MKNAIVILSVLNILFLFMHEFDACFQGEWKMFRFLRNFSDKTQYLVFLYFHVPLSLFAFYYLWTIINFNNLLLWVVVNALSVLHLLIHIMATKWESNVFKDIHSFIFITGAAITGVMSLLMFNYYQ